MIKAYLLKRNKSKSLRTQIRNVERELLNRQQRTGVRTATLVRKIQRIRIDCVSVANHNLIRLLDEPGNKQEV